MMLLDDLLPNAEIRSRHDRFLPVPPEVALEAAVAVTLRQLGGVRVLMALRAIPSLVRRRSGLSMDMPILELAGGAGFVTVASTATERVVVHAGRYWRPRGGLHRSFETLDQFRAFTEPGFAKAAAGLWAEEAPGGSLLVTQTMVATTDDDARRAFRRYWRVVGRPSGWIRSAWLKAAERGVR